jgi:hypothetical protein
MLLISGADERTNWMTAEPFVVQSAARHTRITIFIFRLSRLKNILPDMLNTVGKAYSFLHNDIVDHW